MTTSGNHKRKDKQSSLSANVLSVSFSKTPGILGDLEFLFMYRPVYLGIITFLKCFQHVAGPFSTPNRLHQNAEDRSVRARFDETPPYEHDGARSHRSSRNWWRNRTLYELKNRYLLCYKEYFCYDTQFKSDNGRPAGSEPKLPPMSCSAVQDSALHTGKPGELLKITAGTAKTRRVIPNRCRNLGVEDRSLESSFDGSSGHGS
jgi:hypothetical protein